jgi:hypothetical protein
MAKANHYYLPSHPFSMKSSIILSGLAVIAALIAGLHSAPTASAFAFDPLGNIIPQAGKTKPRLPNGGIGFGGIIAGIESCTCKDIGMLLKIVGPYGGNYLFSFRRRPSLSAGSFFTGGLPVLGAAQEGGGQCGIPVGKDCKGQDTDGVITMIGGILTF